MDSSPVWHADAEFWETFREFVFPPEKIEQASEEVDKLLALLDLESDAAVLDIPCGVGRHSVELAGCGFRVTGVDATAAYLEAANERAREAGVDVEFVHEDMREFRREGTFDAILNVYTSFGYFEDRADDERVARNFYESLKPGGVLVMSLTSKEVLAGKFRKRTWEDHDGTYVLEEHEVSDDWSWMENRWIVVDGDRTREFSVSHRLYSAYELSELLRGVGFNDVTVFGDLEGSDYDENAEHLVVVARK